MPSVPVDIGNKRDKTGARLVSLHSDRGRNTSRVRKLESQSALRRGKRLSNLRSTLAFERAGLEQENSPRPLEASSRKRKRTQEAEALLESDPTTERRKRARALVEIPLYKGNSNRRSVGTANDDVDPITYWSRYSRWPAGYSKSSDTINYLLARKKSETSLSRKSSDVSFPGASNITPSDDRPRELKSAPYRHPGYKVLLSTFGSFMNKSERGITDSSKTLCKSLLVDSQKVPEDSLFRDDVFEETCEMVQDRNEAKVIQDITRLIVPSAQTLAIYGSTHLKILIESVNEGWNNSIPLTKTRPQPDYAVGFRREAFTADQLRKMEPFLGGLFDVSYFMATYYLYFPFLTCEVKCGATALDVADRQNAHSMTLTVRGVVELFRLVKREQELDREILAFSISHDHRAVRIYGHYAEIDGREQKYYRHPIREFIFTDSEGKEKWTAYQFTKNVYDIWMPKHFQRLCEVIDQLPRGVSFEVSQQSELQFSEPSGLSQVFQDSNLGQSFTGSQPSQELVENQSSVVAAQNVTPNTSLNECGSPKRSSRKRGRKATRTPSPKA